MRNSLFRKAILLSLIGGLWFHVTCPRVFAHPAIFFDGKVRKGETFTQEILNRFIFILKPNPYGWEIVMREKGRPKENLARLTPPFHFVPNPRYIEGWHFRNADNTGPNDVGAKNVNAPQHVRNFIFSPMVGKEIDYPVEKKDRGKLPLFSRGTLTISKMQLGNLKEGERAVFESMEFRVKVALGE